MQRHSLQIVTCLLHTRWYAAWACKYVSVCRLALKTVSCFSLYYIIMQAYGIQFHVQKDNDFFFFACTVPCVYARHPTWVSWTIESRQSGSWALTPTTAPLTLECLWLILTSGRSRRSLCSWRNG